MRRYQIQEGTPLKFHNFIRFFSIPVGLLLILKQLFLDIMPYIGVNNFYIYDLSYTLIVFALFITTFIGFLRWKAYAWYSWMTYMVLAPIHNLVLIAICAIYLPDKIAAVISQFVGALLYCILTSIYYIKRRPLFIPFKVNAGTIEGHPYSQSEILSEPVDKSEPADKKAFCSQCNAELPHPGGAFCPNCGYRIGKNEDMTEGL